MAPEKTVTASRATERESKVLTPIGLEPINNPTCSVFVSVVGRTNRADRQDEDKTQTETHKAKSGPFKTGKYVVGKCLVNFI